MGTRLPLPSETHVRVGVGEKILSAEGFTLAELANLEPFFLAFKDRYYSTRNAEPTALRLPPLPKVRALGFATSHPKSPGNAYRAFCSFPIHSSNSRLVLRELRHDAHRQSRPP